MKHPEQKENEVFLGNFTKGGYYSIGWKTKRVGEIAYYADISKVIPHNYNPKYYPIFVQSAELQKAGITIDD
jgi:hypothetical protein